MVSSWGWAEASLLDLRRLVTAAVGTVSRCPRLLG